MDRPLHITIRSSRIAQYYCVAVMLLSWLGIGLADIPWFMQLLLATCVVAYGWRAMLPTQLLAIRQLDYRGGSWFLHVADTVCEVNPGKKFFIGAGIISVPFTADAGKKYRLLLWPDSADADSLRRLRATLLAL